MTLYTPDEHRWKQNRLARLMHDFALRMELLHKIYADGSGAMLVIPESEKSIIARYNFDPSGDSYTFGAVLRGIQNKDLAVFALRILTSKPMIGITERILDEKFVVLGGRDMLHERNDAQVIEGFMDEVARIAAYYRNMNSS